LNYYDRFGLYPKFKPRTAKVFGETGKIILEGLKQYVQEITTKTFPPRENYFAMKDEKYEELLKIWTSIGAYVFVTLKS
jgi:ketopantoate hydroxymethyltransferase